MWLLLSKRFTLINDLAPSMIGRLTIAVLGAGAASRFGGGKLDARINGQMIGRMALNAAAELGNVSGKPLIITRNPIPQFARAAQDEGIAKLLINPDANSGMASSVRMAAAHAARSDSDGLLLLLADMPLVQPGTLAALAAAATAQAPAAVRHPQGRIGIPACFPRAYFADLMRLRGDRGAAALLAQTPDTAIIDAALWELADIDRPADLYQLEQIAARQDN